MTDEERGMGDGWNEVVRTKCLRVEEGWEGLGEAEGLRVRGMEVR